MEMPLQMENLVFKNWIQKIKNENYIVPVKVHVHASSQIPILRCQFKVRVQLEVE